MENKKEGKLKVRLMQEQEQKRYLGSQRVFLELFDVIVESLLCQRTHLAPTL